MRIEKFVMLMLVILSMVALPVWAEEGVATWAELQERIDRAADGDCIALTEDINAGEDDRAIMIPEGKMITLDLVGHTIDRGLGENSTTFDSVIRIPAGAFLE